MRYYWVYIYHIRYFYKRPGGHSRGNLAQELGTGGNVIISWGAAAVRDDARLSESCASHFCRSF